MAEQARSEDFQREGQVALTGKGGGGTAGTVGGSIGNISQGYAANQSTNLSGSC